MKEATPTGAVPPVLQVRNLKKHFPLRGGLLRRQRGAVQVVDGISFDVMPGETLALVGGPGSGKTVLARTILQLAPATGGSVLFRGRDLARLGREALRTLRQQTQLIFQDPYRSLNPRLTVAKLVEEPLEIHGIGDAAARQAQVADLLRQVGLNPFCAERPPAYLSGLHRQRVNLARALAPAPALLVLDEPLAALDEAVHPLVVGLLQRLQQAHDLTYLVLTAALRPLPGFAQRVGILYLGRLVELAETADLFSRPLHPYTQALLSTLPVDGAGPAAGRRPLALSGPAPDPASPPPGCRFHPRCPYATDVCRREDPVDRELGQPGRAHRVACHHAEQFM